MLYAVAVVVLGALLAPWLFWLVWPVAELPFRRVFNRAVLLVALAGLWPLLRYVGICSWDAVGWARSADWWRQLGWGLMLGIGSLSVVALLLLWADGRQVDWGRKWPQLSSRVGQYALTAAVVAVMEETFFRGGLQRALRQDWPAPAAVALTSVVYAAVHFLKPERVAIAPAEVTWSSGFTCLAGVFAGSLGQPDVGVVFGTLVLVGWVLGWAFEWTAALYLPIGLHAGWVLPNELCKWLKIGNPAREPWTWPLLLAVWGAVAWLTWSRTPRRV